MNRKGRAGLQRGFCWISNYNLFWRPPPPFLSIPNKILDSQGVILARGKPEVLLGFYSNLKVFLRFSKVFLEI